MRVETEDVGGRIQPTQFDELGNALFAQPRNIHRAARNEMFQSFETLCRANQTAGAAHVDFAFLGDGLATAFGAMIGEDVQLARLVARQVLQHLRDHVAGALDQHPVAGPKPEPRDLVAIVQRDIGDDHPTNSDRGQPPDRSELAGAPDLDVDRFQRTASMTS